MRKKLVLIFALLIGMGTLFAQEFSALNSDGKMVYYTILNASKGEVKVSKAPTEEKYKGVIVIPDSVKYGERSFVVKEVGNLAFYDSDSLIEVRLPQTVGLIGVSAFQKCVGLSRIVMGNAVKKIDNNAFFMCGSLEEIYLGDSLEEIGKYTFGNCNSLREIVFPQTLRIIGKSAFNNCSNLQEIVIPDSVKVLDKNVFQWCFGLRKVTIGSGVELIDDKAFWNCDMLEKLYVRALEPPVMGIDVINEYNYEINVYVPCESMDAYLADTTWQKFIRMKCGDGRYDVVVESVNEDWGTVIGGGEYEDGDTVVLSAMANEGYHFVRWDDGDTLNPRNVLVISDSVFRAIFEKDVREGVDKIDEKIGIRVWPNPTNGVVRVGVEGIEWIEVYDVLGKKVMECCGENWIDMSELNGGVYVLRIVMGKDVTVMRVVKE